MIPALQATGLCKSFGGVTAASDVVVDAAVGRIDAVIGPNGAGKTTLINLLSGDLRADAGRILFNGTDVTGFPLHKRAKMGIGRSYQRSNIFPQFTCRENCLLAAQVLMPSSFRFFRPVSRLDILQDIANAAMVSVDIAGIAETRAGDISHGAKRQLELAMLLTTNPPVLLLDEPLAGLGQEESYTILELIRSLRTDHAIILVEHDMDAVFSVADRITVMVNGSVMETGTPAEVQASQQVRDAYLGEGASS